MPPAGMPVCRAPSAKAPDKAGRDLPAPHGGRAAGWCDDPEVRLMLRVTEGDQEAFRSLQARYAPRVFGYFCKQLRDRSEAEDLTQEVFLRLYRSRLRYQPRARFATWIFHITQNVGRNALRSRRRRPCVHLDLCAPSTQSLLEGALPDRAGPPGWSVERDEVVGKVREAVAELAGRSRTAVELHQFKDHSY